DFTVIEITRAGELPDVSDDPLDMGLGAAALRMHRPPLPRPDAGWQRTSVSWFTTPRTRALAIVLRTSDARRDELARWKEHPSHPAWFDDVSLQRVDPTPQQAIALLKGRDLAPDADAALGVSKHGQFPPLPEMGTAHAADEDNYSHRYALY